MTVSFRRASLAATVAIFAAAGPASAATLTNSGGVLTFTGTDAENVVTFAETGAAEVTVDRGPGDTDPIAPDPVPGCATTTMGETYVCSGVTRVVANGASDDDELDGLGLLAIPITVNGGAGDDLVSGGGAVDTVNGDAGQDIVSGEGNDDTVNGGSEGDILFGDAGNDLVNGGDRDDLFNFADPGDDRFFGEAGNDTAVGGSGNDEFSGGTGFDTAIPFFNTPPTDSTVTLDDVADDSLNGDFGEADNVRSDVEAVIVEPHLLIAILPPSGNDTFIGSASPNTLTGGQGNDTLDGQSGNDVLNGGDDDDTLRARDGYADFVNCGAGADTAEVDTLDSVRECETVNSANVGNANDVPEIPEDAAPTVALTGPPSGALLRTSGPTPLTATATDDKGIAQVLFLDDERIVCADTTPPYTCDYQPRGEDVGRNTVVAVAVDTAQQTASTVRAFNVGRFDAPGITGAVTPAGDFRAPFVFRTSGRLRLPAFVTAALGCTGQVSVQVKAGSRTISTRRAELRRDCSFSSAVRFADRRRFTRNGRLRFTLRFNGNEILNRSAALARNIRTRG